MYEVNTQCGEKTAMEQTGDGQTAYLCLHNPHPNTCGLKTVFAVPRGITCSTVDSAWFKADSIDVPCLP